MKILQQQELNIAESVVEDTKVAEEQTMPVSANKQVKDETNLLQENLSSTVAEEPPKVAKKEENKQEKKPTETTEVKFEGEVDEQIDMSGILRRQLVERLFFSLEFSLLFVNDNCPFLLMSSHFFQLR